MRTIQVVSVACIAIVASAVAVGQETVSSGSGQFEEGRRDSKWRAQVGWVHQWNRRMTVTGMEPTLSISEVGGRRLLPASPGVRYPDNSAFIPRTFDNGYVHPDYWTGDPALLDGPNAERYGMTWNWGANDPGQYNHDGGNHPTLTFHVDRGHAVMDGPVGISGNRDNQNDNLPVDGIELKLNRLLHAWVKESGDAGDEAEETVLTMDLVFRLAWFPKEDQRFYRSESRRVRAVSETYTYFDYYGGEGSAGLELPYSGTFGTATEAGPLIPATPESVQQHSRFLGTVNQHVALKSEMWRLRGAVGPEFVKPLTERFRVYVSPQLVLEVVRMEVVRSESVTFTSGASGVSEVVEEQVDRRSRTSVVPGLLLSAGADYDFTENWFFSAGLGYEWLTENPSLRVGPSRVGFKLEGGEFNLSVGRWL